MRALIDIPDDQVEALAELAKREKVSRAALIRRAISEFVEARGPTSRLDSFGLWSAGEEGLAFEDRVRSEW